MKKVTIRDLLKDVFSQRGGNIDDWKRVSLHKDSIGRTVREFQNRATGQLLEIIQTSKTEHIVVEKTPAQSKAANGLASESTLKPQ
jgi:hypothetical protein